MLILLKLTYSLILRIILFICLFLFFIGDIFYFVYVLSDVALHNDFVVYLKRGVMIFSSLSPGFTRSGARKKHCEKSR